ncbi:hypothetical protein [Kitasatospora sp. NPDC097691]|uniref:hypothetical protein n=1 Tax=Kitasatospora sp. NPDC097691 TaxID=3157231 RepID=UPI003321F995
MDDEDEVVPGTGTTAWARAGRGAQRFLLTAFAVAGIAVVVAAVALSALVDWSGPNPTDTGDFGPYLRFSALWAVGAGVVGLVGAEVRRSRSEESGLAWLAWCDLGLLLALLWPLQALAIAAVATFGAVAGSRAGGRARWLRGCAAPAAVCLAVAGAAWGVTGYEAEQPWTSADPADRAVVGTWSGPNGETLTLAADGGFRVTAATTATEARDSLASPWYPGEGRWRLTDMVGPGQTLTLTFASGTDNLVVYGALTPSTLCRPFAEEWCSAALHR